MRRSCGARAFVTCATAVSIAVSVVAPAGAQRLRSPAGSLSLATPSVTCGASPRVNLSWTDAASTATATYRVMSNTATGKANAWSAGAYLGNVRSTSVAAANGSSWKFAIEAKTSVTRDSNVQSVTVDCPAVDTAAPSVPSITSALASSCSAVSLSWTAATDTGGSGLAGYNVWRDSAFVKRVTSPAATDSGLLGSTRYSYQVSALDNAGNQSARSVAAAVTTPLCSNTAPTAIAGPDRSAQTLDTVSFDGSASSDSDGTVSSYVWTFGDQAAPAYGPTASHAYASSGTYTVTLTVTDDQGATGQDTAIVTVANRAPFANAGPDLSATAGTPVTLDGSNSFDVDGSIASYRWTFGDGTPAANTVSASHAYATAGTFTATLTVTDNQGAIGQDTALVTVGAAVNVPPVANAGPDQSAAVGALVAFTSAGSSDPDGTIAAYNWNFGDGSTAATATPSHAFATAGTFTVTLTVTDNSGASASDVMNVMVSTVGASTWARSIGGVGSDQVTAVATDAAGNVYVTGIFSSSVTIGAFPLASAGGADVFLAKYSPAGQVLWARRMGGVNAEQVLGIAVDAAGHVDLVGQYFDTADFGGTQPLVSTRSGSGGATQNLFVAQYATADGGYQWAKSFGGPNTAAASGVAVDSSANVYVTGFFTGSINFGGSTLNAPNANDRDSFVAKLSVSGAHVWSRHFTSNSTDQGVGIEVDGSGNVGIVGYFVNGLNLGGADMTALNSFTDIYVAKLDANGNHVWSKKLGSDLGNEDARGIAFDPSGNVVIVGVAISAVNFGGGLLSAGGQAYGYVAKYGAASGSYLWANRIGGPSGPDSANAVDVDASGNVLVAGAFDSSTIDFVGGQQLARIGSTDGFVAKFTAGGALSWARAYGGASVDVLQAINAAPGGTPVTGGYFNDSATMEGTSLTIAGQSDGVVIRTSP